MYECEEFYVACSFSGVVVLAEHSQPPCRRVNSWLQYMSLREEQPIQA